MTPPIPNTVESPEPPPERSTEQQLADPQDIASVPSPERTILRLHVFIQRAIVSATSHDWLNLAQSCAYSAIVSLFPALIVAAAIVSLVPETAPFRSEISLLFYRILPSDVSPLVQSYFIAAPHHGRSARVLFVAVIVSITGASSVIATLMEGVRRASYLPADCWTFWQRRRRALALVPLSLLPLTVVSLLVVFGHVLILWLGQYVDPEIRTPVYIVAILFRWTVALTGSVALIALIYHMGTPMRKPWKSTLPGAIVATLMWFLSTLTFGWYVTRFANYSLVYGSLGAGIALLFWLYIISLSVLFGAEFNMQFHSRRSSGTISAKAPTNSQLPG